jgi:hypothetical protein
MVSRTKTWISNETLTAADLNAEFNGIVNAISTATADHIDLTDAYAWTGAHSWSGATTHTNTLTVGVDDAGHDVKFFGNAAGAFSLWDASADTHIIRGATAAGPGKLNLSTGELTVVDGDILGRIDFQAPLETSGTDAIAVGASIWAEADDTFASGLNDTDLVFAVAESETAAERMRLSYDGTTVGLTFPGVTTISTAAGALNLTPAAGSAIVLDGTINVDAGVVTGATSITSTAFVGDITGDVTGNADTFTATANDSANETVYPVFVDGATGAQGAETDTGLTYNPSTGLLSTATLTTTGVVTAASLDISGDADIDGTLEADAYTVDGTALNEYIADTIGAMVTGTETGISVSYDDSDNTLDFVVGTLNQDTTGTAALATSVTASANNSSDETVYPTFVDGATGTQGIETDTGLTYNPSTGLLSTAAVTATGVVTAATCEATGDTSAGDNAAMGYTSAEGLILTGQGSTNDITIKNDADGNIMVCKTGGTVVDFPGKVGIGTAHTDGTLHVHTATAGSITAEAGADDLVVENNNHGGITILTPAAKSAYLYFGDVDDADIGGIEYSHYSDSMRFYTNTAERVRIGDTGVVYIGDTANGNMSLGLTINQGTNDNQILAFKSTTDVAGGTVGSSETDDFGWFAKVHATGGGLLLSAKTDAAATSSTPAFRLNAYADDGFTDSTKGTTGIGVIDFHVQLHDSANSLVNVGADVNIVTFKTRTSSAERTRFIFDTEGSAHSDVEWTTYDTHDDLGLIRTMEEELLGMENPAKTKRRRHLEDVGIIGENSWHFERGKQRAMVNHTRLQMLHHGALMQVADRFDDIQIALDAKDSRIAALENKIKRLEMMN